MFTTLITCDDLEAHLHDPNWVIIDCRFSLADTDAGRRAYAEAHIPGALYAHLDEDLSGEVVPGLTGRHPLPEIGLIAERFGSWGIGDGLQVVAYDDMSGAIAARLWWMLHWLGHDTVAVLEGGWPAWIEYDRPVSTLVPEPQPQVFHPQPHSDMLVHADLVDRIRSDETFKLIDSRAPERYRGEMEPIDPVAGHIPGAVNRPHTANVRDNGEWLSPEELHRQFEVLLDGVKSEHAVFYCGSGVTACRNILALHYAGMRDAKLYGGSWSEWITDPEREVAKGAE